jgi:hypothetical protein
MKYLDYLRFRETFGLEPADVARELHLDEATVDGWERCDPEQEMPEECAKRLRSGLVDPVFKKTLIKDCDEAFLLIPSETIGIWVVSRGRECILLPEASRVHDFAYCAELSRSGARPAGDIHRFDEDRKLNRRSSEVTTLLMDESLTTYPLNTGYLLNLGGDAISEHKAKKYPTRTNNLFRGGVCESMLHAPAFADRGNGPQPVLLLSFENKLDGNHQVILSVEGDKRKDPIYSGQDQQAAQQKADDFKVKVLECMTMLDMF